MEIAVDNLRNSEMVAKSGENDGEQGNKNSELQIQIPESFKTPQKPGELDTDLQQLLNQRLQRSRSSSNKKAVVKPTPNRAAATGDSHESRTWIDPRFTQRSTSCHPTSCHPTSHCY